MIIAIHNHKGGIGTTTLVAHLCVLAKELGIRVAGCAADFKQDLPRFLGPENIPCIDIDPQREEPDYDLFIIDVQSHTKPPIDPDVWIIPISDHGAAINGLALSDSLRAPMIWLGNKGRKLPDVPAYLQGAVEIAGSIPYSRAIRCAGDDDRIVWSVPELAHTAGALYLRAALHDLLEQAIALSGEPLVLPSRKGKWPRPSAPPPHDPVDSDLAAPAN